MFIGFWIAHILHRAVTVSRRGVCACCDTALFAANAKEKKVTANVVQLRGQINNVLGSCCSGCQMAAPCSGGGAEFVVACIRCFLFLFLFFPEAQLWTRSLKATVGRYRAPITGSSVALRCVKAHRQSQWRSPNVNPL